jgi:hypothetical protein
MVTDKQKRMTSFVETLEGRQLFSATGLALDAAAATAAGGGGGGGKVSMQDIGIVIKVSKPSPGLTADSSAGKVAMQDFHFVAKVNKPSPT